MRAFPVLLVVLAGAALLVSQPGAREQPGPRRDGGTLLATGWTIRPAGRQIPLSTFPMASAVSRSGKFVVILQGGYLKPSLSVHEAPTMREVSRVEVADAWLGLAFAPNSDLLYVSGGSQACVYEYALGPEGQLEERRTFPIVRAEDRKHTDFIGDVALSPDGRLIYAAGLYTDVIHVINPQSGMVIEHFRTAHRPYRILFHPDGKSFFVTGWGDGSLLQHETSNGKVMTRVPLGPAPMDMVWRDKKTTLEDGQEAPFKARLFVAVSNTNRVFVLGVSEEKSLRIIEYLNVALTPNQPAGMTPSALALSADQDQLYVACSDANAVAVADVSGPRGLPMGFVPTGWYPVAARELAGGWLLVLNGRGGRSFPNPRGPRPDLRQAPAHQGGSEVEYVGRLQSGTASLVPPLGRGRLDTQSQIVLANSPYRDELLLNAGSPPGNPIPARLNDYTPIEHVVYILKENRTYDQVFGGLAIGNGDASLVLFGEDVTPNHHKLAREFVLLDNFYVNADVSADGHNWSSAAIAPAYVQRLWPNSYGGRRRHYDYEGGERAAMPPAGYLWSNALARGHSVRNYGWWVTNIDPAPSTGRQVSVVRDSTLAMLTSMEYRGFDMGYKDIDRAAVFLKELAQFERDGRLPRLVMMRLPNDHTSGTAAGQYAPKAAVADNDYALGMVVEALTRSRFWPKMAIFVLEDDAQNGPDHVDSHRAPAFVISPFTRGRGVDSTMYNTVSMLRTIELILGLRPMTMFDAAARPMYAAFNATADMAVYVAEKPRVSLEERNGAGAPRAARSAQFDFSEADRIDDDELNDILWRAVRGGEPPPPVRSMFAR